MDNPFAWRIPQFNPLETTISAGGYLVLWLDGEPLEGIRHTNFKLRQSGEAVGLFDPSGQPIDSVAFDVLETDVSWGRLPDGSGEWTELSSPSPGRANKPAPSHRPRRYPGHAAIGKPICQGHPKRCRYPYNTNVILDHLSLDNVNFPIFFQYGSVILSHSTIQTDVTCDYINVKYAKATIYSNTFYGNLAPDTDAIDLDGTFDSAILDNRIYNFQGFNCDAIDIGEQSQGLLIEGNVIYNSSDKGISIGQESDAFIINNVIVDCGVSIGLKDTSFAEIDKNTLVSNGLAVACFEKNYGKGGGNAVIRNTLFSNSLINDIFVDLTSQASVAYCLSDMAFLPGEENLYSDPGFIDRRDYNFQLTPTSVCLDAGSPADQTDLDGSRSDIGASYVYDQSDFPMAIRQVKGVSVVINEILYKDSPARPSSSWVELYNPTDQAIDLSRWTLTDSDITRFYALPETTVLLPGEFLVICRDLLPSRAKITPSSFRNPIHREVLICYNSLLWKKFSKI